MSRFLRWTVSFLFLLGLILFVNILYNMLFKKPPVEPLKSVLSVFAVILAFFIAAIFNRYQCYRASKRGNPKKS